MSLGGRSRPEILLDAVTRAVALSASRRQVLKILGGAAGGGLLYLLRVAPAYAQTLIATPSCGEAGKTKVCLSGSGWAEPQPPCRYTFFFDGASVAPDQQDGLYGPPSTAFTVPGGAAAGNHTIRVDLRLNSPDNLLQSQTIPFKVIAGSAASSISSVVAGNAITITYTPADSCQDSCKKIVFVQSVQNIAVKPDGTEVPLKATDWTNFPDAANKAGTETDTSRVRVDQLWGVSSPYYTQNSASLPAAGSDDGSGVIGSNDPGKIAATMSDQPSGNAPSNLSVGFPVSKVILRFVSVPFCAEGADAGKPLDKAVTWELHADGVTETIKNVNNSASPPAAGSDFFVALDKRTKAKGFTLPKPKPSPCP